MNYCHKKSLRAQPNKCRQRKLARKLLASNLKNSKFLKKSIEKIASQR